MRYSNLSENGRAKIVEIRPDNEVACSSGETFSAAGLGNIRISSVIDDADVIEECSHLCSYLLPEEVKTPGGKDD